MQLRPRLGSVVPVVGALLLGAGASGAISLPTWSEPVTGMVFIELPPGRFAMGSPPSEPLREPGERLHPVEITRSYWIGRTEVTQAQWQRVMGGDPSRFGGVGELPVESVNWFEIEVFLERLAGLSPGNRFRLPTEAEWERACRAGSATAFAWGDVLVSERANFDASDPSPLSPRGSALGRPTPVASFPPNAWGLFDLHGNVWEWCADEPCPYPAATDTLEVDPLGACGSRLKVIRGGSWHFAADSARCALRYTHAPSDRGSSLGFRVLREPLAPALRPAR